MATLYYGFAILYYTQRARKKCTQLFNNASSDCNEICTENWSAADAVYFATVTMTTVGYGDLKPENTENMVVTLVFLIVGVLIVFTRVAQALSPFYQTLEFWLYQLSESCMRAVLGKRGEGTLVDLDGTRARAPRSHRPGGRGHLPRPLHTRPPARSMGGAWPASRRGSALAHRGYSCLRTPRLCTGYPRRAAPPRPPQPLTPRPRADHVRVGDGLADYEEPPSAFMYYLKGISSWLVMWITTQLGFALIYQAIEPDDLPLGVALYLCVVTATTVGYGDVGVRDSPGHRMFASFHILYSVSSLAALLNTVSMLSAERKLQLRKGTLLQRQLDEDLILSLDKDNNGLDKLEFVVGMLTKLEILHWDDVEPFLAQFDALDSDRSGRLDKSDLMRMVEIKKKKLEEKMAKQTGGKSRVGEDDMAGGAPAMEDGADDVQKLEQGDLEGGGTSPRKEGARGGGSADGGPSLEYGGVAAHNRNRAAAGLAADAGSAVTAGRRHLPFGLRLPFLQLSSTGAGRIRHKRPTHLRSKVGPG